MVDAQAVSRPSLDSTPAAPKPAVVAEVARSRWQTMDAALAACSGGFFDRLLCRQRTRIDYCNGYWGRVDECASGVPSDATR